MEELFDVTTLQGGEKIYYLNYDNGKFLIDEGVVKGQNLYKDGTDDELY